MTPSNTRLWFFQGGAEGSFRVVSQRAIVGVDLPQVTHLLVSQTEPALSQAGFCLVGATSNDRYATRVEKTHLVQQQHAIGRPEASIGAFIPLKKNAAWWALSQDERRAIFEERSGHIALGQRALPQVARRLHHCRDLSTEQPFDFLTWFDFSPKEEPLFNDLLAALRETEEWRYVEREVELRVVRL